MCWVYWIERDSGGVRLLVFFILDGCWGVCGGGGWYWFAREIKIEEERKERDGRGERNEFFILFFIGLYVKIRTKMLTVE